MPESTLKHLDRLALTIGLGGVVLAALIAMLGIMLGYEFRMIAFGVFSAAQVGAIVLGIMTRASLIGRAAAITSSILLVCSVLFLG